MQYVAVSQHDATAELQKIGSSCYQTRQIWKTWQATVLHQHVGNIETQSTYTLYTNMLSLMSCTSCDNCLSTHVM